MVVLVVCSAGVGLSGGLLQEQRGALVPLGLLAVGLALLASVMVVSAHQLTRAWLRGERLPAWTGALAVGLGAAVLHWLSPSGREATPWISGGLVVTVPLVIVCVAAAAAWVTRRSTRRLPTVAAVVVSVGTAATLLVPEAAATLPHAAQRVSQGQVAAVQRVCRALPLRCR